jgi:hypothetical protein
VRHHLHRHGVVSPVPLGMRPPRWQRWAVHGTLLALLVTGAAWLIAHYLLHAGSDAGGEAPPPALETWALRLHGMAAYAFLVVLGSMSAVHIALGWRARRNRASGAGLVAAALMLAISALGLYYGPESAHTATSVFHWVCGLALPPLLWLHIVIARRGLGR